MLRTKYQHYPADMKMRLRFVIFTLVFGLPLLADPVPEKLKNTGKIVDEKYNIRFPDLAPRCPWQLEKESEVLKRLYSCTFSETNEQASITITSSDDFYRADRQLAEGALAAIKKQMKAGNIAVTNEKIEEARVGNIDSYLVTADLQLDAKRYELLHYVIANNQLMSLQIIRLPGSAFGRVLISDFRVLKKAKNPEEVSILMYSLVSAFIAGLLLVTIGFYRKYRKNKTLT